jgi:hypothetical protein
MGLKLFGVDDHAALRAAVGNAHGALAGHPERQRLDLIQRDIGVEADAALGGPRVLSC